MWANRDATAVLAAELRARRKAARLSQRQLAERARVSVATIQNLELGRSRRLRSDQADRLAEALGVDPSAESPRRVCSGLPRIGADRGDPEIGPRPEGAISVQLLGPLRVCFAGQPLALGPLAQRAVLGLVALGLGEEVRRETITDTIWGPALPASAVNMVQKYFGRLRRIFDSCDSGILVSTGTSYKLRIDLAELDLLTHQRLIDRAREAVARGDVAGSCDHYANAVKLWRGDPLEDIGMLREYPAVTTLSRLRTTIILEYAEVAMGTRAHESALQQLVALVQREPLNERAFARIMLMLAAMGEQAAALLAFEKIRRCLHDQLGISPSRPLSDAYLCVLRQEVPVMAGSLLTGSALHSAKNPPWARTSALNSKVVIF